MRDHDPGARLQAVCGGLPPAHRKHGEGQSVRGRAAKLQLPYTEATPEDIPENDPYQLTRWWTNVLSASIPAKVAAGRPALIIEQILNTPLLTTVNPKVCLA